MAMATDAALHWRINILGDLSLSGPATGATDFETRRAALLLIRVALCSQSGVSREELADALWPDEFPDVSRPRLRQELSRLRRALGSAAEILECDRLHVRLDRSLATVDREEYEKRLVRARAATDPESQMAAYQEATSLYTGDLAPGYMEPWVVAERLRLQRLQVGALLKLTKLLEEAG
jgi:DNA-binding SARP family transcriptional activator